MDARAEGAYLPLPGPRRFIGDLVHFAHKVPSAPVSRTFDVSALVRARADHPVAAFVGVPVHEGVRPGRRQHAPLRRSYLEFPWSRLYEHPG